MVNLYLVIVKWEHLIKMMINCNFLRQWEHPTENESNFALEAQCMTWMGVDLHANCKFCNANFANFANFAYKIARVKLCSTFTTLLAPEAGPGHSVHRPTRRDIRWRVWLHANCKGWTLFNFHANCKGRTLFNSHAIARVELCSIFMQIARVELCSTFMQIARV